MPTLQDKRLIKRKARKYGISPKILYGLWGTETHWSKSPTITSSAGARGPFQFMPATARSYGINPGNFRQAADAAAKYLGTYKGRGTAGMLSSYVAGPAGGIHMDYVNSVLANAKQWKPVKGGKYVSGGAGKGMKFKVTKKPVNIKHTTLTPETKDIDYSSAIVDALLSGASRKEGLFSAVFDAIESGAYTTVTPSTKTVKKEKIGTEKRYKLKAGSTPQQVQMVKGVPVGTKHLKGTASFEGVKVAAWIQPWLVYARKHGWKGEVNSGWRSFADQTRIYNSGVRPAAKPGTSNHEGANFPRGAVDVSDAATLSAILRKAGSPLIYAGAKDPVHFSHPHDGSY